MCHHIINEIKFNFIGEGHLLVLEIEKKDSNNYENIGYTLNVKNKSCRIKK